MNLKRNIDLCEELPQRVPIKFFISKTTLKQTYYKYPRGSYLAGLPYYKYQKILYSMVNKSYNEILNKFIAIWPKNCEYSVKEQLDREDKIIFVKDKKFILSGSSFRGDLMRLEDYFFRKSFVNCTIRYYFDEYNIFRKFIIKPIKKIKIAYYNKHRKKKLHKTNENKHSEMLGLLMNNKDILLFYQKICYNIKSIENDLLRYERLINKEEECKNTKFDKWLRYDLSVLIRKKPQLSKDLKYYKNQIEEFHKGDFSSYYSSNDYLFNQKKRM